MNPAGPGSEPERGQRDRVAAQLDLLNGRGGDLWVDSPHATIHQYGDDAARMRVWGLIREEYLARQAGVDTEGRALIVSAGPPGAGKTTAITSTLGDISRWRRIDPDALKEMLIERELGIGTFDRLLSRRLADERPIMPLELSSLVHKESVELAAHLRDRCMRAGENVIVEGTLAWKEMPRVHAAEVLKFGYDQVAVLSVQVPHAVALVRVIERWWRDRCDSASPLGGRFLPRTVIDACYLDDVRTTCQANAQELVRLLDYKQGLQVVLHTVDGTGFDVPGHGEESGPLTILGQ